MFFNRKVEVIKDAESQLKTGDEVAILEFNCHRGNCDFKAKVVSEPFRSTKNYNSYIEEQEYILVECDVMHEIPKHVIEHSKPSFEELKAMNFSYKTKLNQTMRTKDLVKLN